MKDKYKVYIDSICKNNFLERYQSQTMSGNFLQYTLLEETCLFPGLPSFTMTRATLELDGSG